MASATQVTDGMSDAGNPVFDKDGKYLYFTASTNSGRSHEPDMHSCRAPVTRSVYLVVLAKDQPSPLAPESDEEKAQAGRQETTDRRPRRTMQKDESAAESDRCKIDFDNIGQRILALPMPPRRYVALAGGQSRHTVCHGSAYAVAGPRRSAGADRPSLRSEDAQNRRRRRRVCVTSRCRTTARRCCTAGRQLDHRDAAAHGTGSGAPPPPPPAGYAQETPLKTEGSK